MAVEAASLDLRQTVVSNSTFGPNEIRQIAAALSADYSNFRTLRDAVIELEQQPSRSPAASARLGVCQYLLGRYRDAVTTLTSAVVGDDSTIDKPDASAGARRLCAIRPSS